MIRHGGREVGNLVNLGGAGGAEDQGDAVKQKGGGKGAKQEST